MKVLRALLIVPCVGLAMSAARAAEPAFVIPAPAVDQSAAPHSENDCAGRRLLLGRAGGFSAHQGCDVRDFRLRWRRETDGAL